MTEPADSIKTGEAETSLLIARYFSETAKGPMYRRTVAMREWRSLHPKQRQRLQHESQIYAAGDIALSEAYTQSVMVLERARRLVRIRPA